MKRFGTINVTVQIGVLRSATQRERAPRTVLSIEQRIVVALVAGQLLRTERKRCVRRGCVRVI
jgi:hypothetical protein